MNCKHSLLFLFVLFLFSGYTYGQTAKGVIAPSRMVDWSQAGVVGGIPNRTTICATLSPGASASQINSAIASCPSNQVVFLKAGTYTLSAGINFAQHGNVTLRGAGSDKTFVVFNGNVSCDGRDADVCIGGIDNAPKSPRYSANWTGGYSKGTTQITLSSASGLGVGSILILDQLNDSSDTGNIFVCDASGVCSSGGSGGGDRPGRAQQQIVQVTSISGSGPYTVGITPGIYMPNWRSSQSPQGWWSGPASTSIANAGVEDMSLDHTNSTTSPTGGIVLYNAKNCWVKNIRSINAERDHVWLVEAIHSTVLNSYFYGTQRGSTSEYGVEAFMSSDNLVENNIFQHVVDPITLGGSTAGSVYAYNYSLDDWYSPSSSWMMYSDFNHGAGVDSALFEGNVGNGLIGDDTHGTHNMVTAFRNRYTGWESGKTQQTTPIQLYLGSRYFNIIGNVLGKVGYHTQYQDVEPNGTNSNKSIYTLGWSGSGGKTGSAGPNDPKVAGTLMRWGNYDTVTGTVKWDSSEVPSSISLYSNPVPSTHTLPASFYLSARPSWWSTPWGTPPWPAIGPDVSGGTGPGGYSNAIPAELCYNNTSKNGSGILNFSATSCYGNTTAPAAPTNLGAVPH